MRMTRRAVVGGLSCTLFVPPKRVIAQTPSASAPSPRMDLRTFSSNPALVQSLKDGVRVMQSRRPSDPTSWFFQAAIHGVPPPVVEDMTNQDPSVSSVSQYWNQCPHHGQPSAGFLPWHRAYLYYFERILREASGNPGLSLPYWNYTDGDRFFPQIFADPEADASGRPTNPLYVAARDPDFASGQYSLSDDTVSVAAAMASPDFFGSDDSSGFGGGVADEDPGTKGMIEVNPHDLIHVAVGGEGVPGESSGGWMSSTYTAAFDPIFWVHHANIDRLWSTWDCGAQHQWGAVPNDAWFEQTPWKFFDIDGSPKTETVGFYIDRRNSAAAYDTDDPSCRPLSASNPEQVLASARTLSPVVRTASSAARTLSVDNVTIESKAGIKVGPDARVDSTVALTSAAPNVRGLRSLLESEPAEARKVVVELRGVKTTSPPSVGFDVFVDLPDGEPARRSDERYVGTVSMFGLNHKGVQHFDISNWIRKHGADPKSVKVSIVPFDLFEPKPGKPRVRRNGGITIDSLGVVVLGTPGQ